MQLHSMYQSWTQGKTNFIGCEPVRAIDCMEGYGG